MESGNLSFSTLFDFIKQHPNIPHKHEILFEPFKDSYSQIIRDVPEIPGWYAWVRITPDTSKVIYIGQSQTRKTANLHARLKEEFLDEYVALWATVWNPDEVVRMLDSKYQAKYTTPIKRSARKAGATNIVWFGKDNLSDAELNVVEHALIRKYNPPANRQYRAQSVSFAELLAHADAALQFELSQLNQ